MKQFNFVDVREFGLATESKMVDGKSSRLRQYGASYSACIGALVVGTCLGWSSPAQSKVSDYPFEVSDSDFSWMGSLYTLGAAIFCIPNGVFINIFGRKNVMLILVLPFIIGWGLIIWGRNLPSVCIGRFICGFASAGITVAAPIYTAEISEKEIRGTTGFFFQLNITIGILISYILGGILDLFIFSLICAAFPILFLLIFVWMPESPLFLLFKEKPEEAKKAMMCLRGKDFNPDSELDEMKVAILAGEISVNPFENIAAFKRKATIKGFIVCMSLMFFQQFCGINAVIFYSTDLFGKAKGVDKHASTMVIGVVQVIATACSTLVVDIAGRRILLMLSEFIMALCTFVLGLYFLLEKMDKKYTENLGWLTVIIVCLFIIMYSCAMGPAPWLMVGELFAPDVKGLCGSLGGTLNWLLAFVVVKAYPSVSDAIGAYGAFWCFTVLSFIGTAFIFFVVPETKGISLNQIQEELEK